MATNTTHNTKINKVKKEISSNSNTAVNAVENKIPNASKLVKKPDYNTKLVKLKIKLLLIKTVIIILLLKNIVS